MSPTLSLRYFLNEATSNTRPGTRDVNASDNTRIWAGSLHRETLPEQGALRTSHTFGLGHFSFYPSVDEVY